jgi:hypothetical protein
MSLEIRFAFVLAFDRHAPAFALTQSLARGPCAARGSG